MGIFGKIFGSYSTKELARIEPIKESVLKLEEQYAAMSDTELKAQTQNFRDRLDTGESIDMILPEALATVREAAYRVLGKKPFPVQIIGAIVLHQGRIAEMKTGEGKTLVACVASYLNALPGKGVHVVTVNDYLAKTQSDEMGKVLRFLGLTVGCILHGLTNEERRAAYNCDVTYATNNELGFDYLRDNMVIHARDRVQRKPNFAIVIPMVMVNGTLYLDTGHESKIEARCGVMDGEITSQVDGNKQPSVDDQSNFGTGYGYQYGATEGTIELFMNGKWWIFATEEARQKIQFPSIEDELSKFYLTIGSEGVKSIKLSMPNSSGGFENADGSLLKKGERIWLENLDGYTDLRGLTITALGENGEIIWTASIPDEEENKGFTHLVNDDWEITNIE